MLSTATGATTAPDNAIGFSIAFPVMDYASLRARKQAEAARSQTETARLDLHRTALNAEMEKAAARRNAARRIAETTPVQLEAARAAQTQATARYRAGLATLADVADAERLLTQSEIDDSLARLGVWRAMLAVAVAEGDLDSFLKAGN